MIPCIEEDSLFFKVYGGAYALIPKTKIFLGKKENRECRFCGKDSKETTFKMKAHIIPEFMGSAKLFFSFDINH